MPQTPIFIDVSTLRAYLCQIQSLMVGAVLAMGSKPAADILKLTKDTVYENGSGGSGFRDEVQVINLTAADQTVDSVGVTVNSGQIKEFEPNFAAQSTGGANWIVYCFGAQADWPPGYVETNYGGDGGRISVGGGKFPREANGL